MKHISSLARPVDPRFSSNLWILGLSLGVALVLIGRHQELSGSLAFGGFVGTFLTWALVREFDPDRPLTALIAAGLNAPAMLWLGTPDLLILGSLMVMARLLTRSVGLPPTALDLVFVTAMGGALGLREGGWLVALGLSFAVVRDRNLPGTPPRGVRLSGLLIASIATGVAVRAGIGMMVSPTRAEWLFILVGVVAALSGRLYDPESKADLTSERLLRRRVTSARRIVGTTALLSVATSGAAAIVATAGVWVGFFAIFVVSVGLIPGGSPEQPR